MDETSFKYSLNASVMHQVLSKSIGLYISYIMVQRDPEKEGFKVNES